MITGKCCSIHYVSREERHTPYFNPKSLIIHWKALSEEEKTKLTIFKGQCFKEHLHSYLIKNNLCHRCYDNVFNQLRNPSEMLRGLITISNKIILNYDELHEEYLLSLLIRGDQLLDIEPIQSKCPNSNTIQTSTEYVVNVISILYKENLDISYSIAFDKSLKMQELLLEEINKSKTSNANKKKRKNRNKKKKVKNPTSETEGEKVNENKNEIINNNNNNNNNTIQTPPPSSKSLQSSTLPLTNPTSKSSIIHKKNNTNKLQQYTDKNINISNTTSPPSSSSSSSSSSPAPPAPPAPPHEKSTSADFEDDTSDSEVESFKALLQTIHQQRSSKKIEVKNTG